MQSLWNPLEAAQYPSLLDQRVYSSRLLGRDKALVMHGGGNTSVKIEELDLLGRLRALLYVKGSGWDLETIQPAGFAPVRMDALLDLAQLESLSDIQMANELRCATIHTAAPAPSVEAILHAIIPHRFVDHTHADAIIALTNNPHGQALVEETFGTRVISLPYVMPGFRLARQVAQAFPHLATPQTEGIILLNHGIFTFGDTAEQSYQRMIELVTLAEKALHQRGAFRSGPSSATPVPLNRAERAAFRQHLSAVAGNPLILSTHSRPQAMAFVTRGDLAQVAGQGPLTPDHVIRTKRLPLIGRDVDGYAQAYRDYFADHASRSATPLTMLDPAPRVILDPDWGMLTAGRTARDTAVSADIYRHTMDVIGWTDALGGYRALPAGDVFEVEYWDLEQAKVRAGGQPPVFTGEVALVTGAASGIGKACVQSLLRRGAAVVGLDINPTVAEVSNGPSYLGLVCDLTDEAQITAALDQTVLRFGGLDMLILNAGIFPAGTPIAQLSLADWDRVMRINLDSNLILLRETHALLRCAPHRGRVVLIGSKNVPAPGPGAAAYSASKAAMTQLARVAALEWGGAGIRINTLHPNAVFDTGLWTEEVLASRAQQYGLTVEQYRTNNLLKVEVTSHDVAELAAELCGPVFSRTTGAQIPIDGGNDRVI
jgi:rhamnose utilization protein RhaD (predicted bifunctional aldolase and dehydrogenase)/NAD(P)-dependent dehydrogenase (short-subunit alcohol dehydrogenase family)